MLFNIQRIHKLFFNIVTLLSLKKLCFYRMMKEERDSPNRESERVKENITAFSFGELALPTTKLYRL